MLHSKGQLWLKFQPCQARRKQIKSGQAKDAKSSGLPHTIVQAKPKSGQAIV